jgi:hypothetical protein
MSSAPLGRPAADPAEVVLHRQAFPELARTEAALLDTVEFDVDSTGSIHCSTP